MKKKRLYILAPNDRFNYGDLLFPYVLTHYLKDSVDSIVYCSTSKSNLSILGGYPTEDFHVLYHLDENYDNYLIVAGGECLLVRWTIIISFISSKYRNFLVNAHRLRLYKIFGEDLINRMMDFLVLLGYKTKTKFPFTVGKNELPGFVDILYNAVGGSWFKGREDLINDEETLELLKSVTYISVRDQVTSDALNNYSIENTLTPDSVILLSKIFSPRDIYAKTSRAIYGFDVNSKYIFFEVNEMVYQSYKEAIIKQLHKIINDGYTIVLCPIGTALGHRDDLALNELYKIIGSRNSFVVSNPSIWDIMWLIVNSNIYIGISLHGAITAMSYGVPFLSYIVEKPKAYISCWYKDGLNSHFCDDVSQIYEKLNLALSIKYEVIEQLKLAEESMNKMKNVINTNQYLIS